MNRARSDGFMCGRNGAGRCCAQAVWRRFQRNRLKGGAKGGILAAPQFHQRCVGRVLQQKVLNPTTALRIEFAVDKRVKIGFF